MLSVLRLKETAWKATIPVAASFDLIGVGFQMAAIDAAAGREQLEGDDGGGLQNGHSAHPRVSQTGLSFDSIFCSCFHDSVHADRWFLDIG